MRCFSVSQPPNHKLVVQPDKNGYALSFGNHGTLLHVSVESFQEMCRRGDATADTTAQGEIWRCDVRIAKDHSIWLEPEGDHTNQNMLVVWDWHYWAHKSCKFEVQGLVRPLALINLPDWRRFYGLIILTPGSMLKACCKGRRIALAGCPRWFPFRADRFDIVGLSPNGHMQF